MVTSVDLQLSVALLAGTAAAMMVPPVRRSVPRWMEALIWLGLIVTCWLAVTNVKEANVRQLTVSLAWGVDQIVKTSVGLMLAAVLAWMSDHRYPIAYAVVMLVGADMLLVALIRTHRQAEESLPRILLGEWIEIPLQRTPPRVEVPYAMDELNRRAERGLEMLGAASRAWLVNLTLWARARVAGRVLRLLAFGDTDQGLTDDQVVNITALLRAQSIGWYGPILPVRPSVRSNPDEGQDDESDQLAS
jgi:hypothetical protein